MVYKKLAWKDLKLFFFCGSCMYLLYIFDRWVSIAVINIGFLETSMKWHETSFFLVVACIYCIYLIDECQRVVIDICFQESSLKRLETTFFCGSCMYLLYIFDRWVSIAVTNIGFLEISMKSLETTFFVVVAWIYCIYLIDECLE